MINNLFALCFESKDSNTEKNFFRYMNESAAEFGWNKVIFTSFDLKQNKCNKENIAKLLEPKFRTTTNVNRIAIFYDRDLQNDILHKKAMSLKSEINNAIISIFENDKIEICWIEIPQLETFEYLLCLFFEKRISVPQLKKELGSNYKSGDSKKIKSLFNKKNLNYLKNNLNKFRNETNWIAIFHTISKNKGL